MKERMTSKQRRELKKNSKKVFKKHYLLFVLIMLLASILGTAQSSSTSLFRLGEGSETDSIVYDDGSTFDNVLVDLMYGNVEAGKSKMSAKLAQLLDTNIKIGGLEFGHTGGTLSSIVNNLASGSILLNVFTAFAQATGSTYATAWIFILSAMLFLIAKDIFVSLVYRPIYIRVMLEGRTYEKVGTQAFLYFFAVKKYVRAAFAVLREYIIETLWYLTIIGGPIKHYAYALTDYIIAENPSVSGKEAMKLSSKMMKGHKWELFWFDCTYLGWDFLGYLTLGITNLFFSAPYYEASRCEYYARMRAMALENGIEGADRILSDKYLFEHALQEDVDALYSDAVDILNRPSIEYEYPNKVAKFFAEIFGLVVYYGPKEKEYRDYMAKKYVAQSYKDIVDNRAYPSRLSPIKVAERHKQLEHTYYLRHYSICSLIFMFFIFCFVGWSWEVAIHIVNDGVFVNRGVMHGPWLPIYGSGAVMILLVLNKLRAKPVIEFISAIVLCGIVEYFTHWFLQVTHDGQKWWDYSGYFLNINGRVCAEGLLVFGLAGVAAVYLLAPMLDNCLSKIPIKIAIIVCAVLVSAFTIDNIYSHKHPNVGKGITDYDKKSACDMNVGAEDYDISDTFTGIYSA